VESSLSPSGSPVPMVTSSSKPGTRQDEEDMCIPPRKRKLRRDEGERADWCNNSTTTNGPTEKAPNPYDVYLSLRKKVGCYVLSCVSMVLD